MERGELSNAEWEPIGDSMDKYDAHLDPGSLQVMSAGAMRSVVGALAKAKLLPTKYILESYGLPQAAELAEEATRELELGAMARTKKPR
jgi:hypothetical protein